ncbi:hypothetical protein E1293_36810 [Actinomadura darangshiensis]|uniref:Cysteinyl-tRNA synthetase n=1 Tax=Actinomadura darangshiensis TaxID=705336 RepID=A0A4R5AF40_9ACTN|nr:hypothetical protein [Actinomadura darangshiensis]TDD68562.1 hypothetical protein E1293_36810 [Actinomadura darangshiensis]
MLRLYDHRTGTAEALPPGRGLRVQLLDGAGYRRPVVADLLRRVAGRAGRQVRAAGTGLTAGDLDDYSVQPFEDGSLPDADVYVSGAADADALCLVVPQETGASPDPLAARLAMLEVHYREPLELTAARSSAAGERLAAWRGMVAEWATSPGRPINRAYASEAEAALADDLDSPAALAVLDRLAADPDVPPGAKLETFIHLDLVLALGLVSAIGGA